VLHEAVVLELIGHVCLLNVWDGPYFEGSDVRLDILRVLDCEYFLAGDPADLRTHFKHNEPSSENGIVGPVHLGLVKSHLKVRSELVKHRGRTQVNQIAFLAKENGHRVVVEERFHQNTVVFVERKDFASIVDPFELAFSENSLSSTEMTYNRRSWASEMLFKRGQQLDD
jgi:hypothetical protein